MPLTLVKPNTSKKNNTPTQAHAMPTCLASYRELQQRLKQKRDEGYQVRCPLNSKSKVLQAELQRLNNSDEKPVPPAPPVNTTGMSYRELQAWLKSQRAAGVELRCKLNAKLDVLVFEYARLSALP